MRSSPLKGQSQDLEVGWVRLIFPEVGPSSLSSQDGPEGDGPRAQGEHRLSGFSALGQLGPLGGEAGWGDKAVLLAPLVGSGQYLHSQCGYRQSSGLAHLSSANLGLFSLARNTGGLVLTDEKK